jgi:Ca-activated chloride channel family protein
MFEFANPWVLLLLPVIPVLVWWWLRRPRGALRYSDAGVLARLPRGRVPLARAGGAILRSIILLCLVVAIAGPRWPDFGSRIETEGIAIQMLVDISGSMAEPDFDWQGQPIGRLDAVKKVFQLFVAGGEGPDGQLLEGRSSDLIGLVTFATFPDSVCPLTLSHSVLLHLLEAERPRTVPSESRTNIGDAIAWGLHRLEAARTARKVMVLLSDGEHNVPPPALTPRQAAQLAANQRVPIYTIDAAGENDVEEGLVGERDPQTAAAIRAAGIKTLETVAHITGGRYFKARDSASLLAVCREIDRMERKGLQSFIYQRYREAYPWVGLMAFGCWWLVVMLETTIWQRWP